jgi:protein CMS1
MPSVEKVIAKLATVQPSRLGQPVILVITGNAQRAADLAKVLRKLSPSAPGEEKKLPVGKLFARHFKVAEQEAFLKSNVCPIAVGTPQRVHELLSRSNDDKSSVLKLNFLKAIVLDASWTDLKMRTVLDNAETTEALCSLLASGEIQTKLRATRKEEQAKIVLF